MKAWVMLGITLSALLWFGTAHAADCVSTTLGAIESGSEAAVVPTLKKGAREGDERCKFILGIWSLSGTGMEPDPEAGAQWLGEAADEGLPIAQSHLGLLYASGLGVEKDEDEAARWYRSAADYGDPLGQAALGVATFRGIGVPKGQTEGYMWTSLAALQGNEKARSVLPKMEAVMTAEDVEQAEGRVAEFRPKKRPRQPQLKRSELLRGFGLHREPTEYDRFFGY